MITSARLLHHTSCADTACVCNSRRLPASAAGRPPAGLRPPRRGSARGVRRLRRATASARRDAGRPGRSGGGPAGTPGLLRAAPAAVARCRGAATAALRRRRPAAALRGALPAAARCVLLPALLVHTTWPPNAMPLVKARLLQALAVNLVLSFAPKCSIWHQKLKAGKPQLHVLQALVHHLLAALAPRGRRQQAASAALAASARL
jgi:hypothetical protein